MQPLKNDRLIRALLRQPVDKTPVWLMRQAGRYLPEYRAIREKAGSFMDLCQNPELACEVTLQPLRRFDLDAAILFSDILTIPDAMGLGLYFAEGEGPKFERPLNTAADVEKLFIPDPHGELRYVMDAVSLIRQELRGSVPLIGFSGSPWTLATYMIEGGSTRVFQKIKAWMYNDPKSLHLLLDKLAESVSQYLNAQIESGAEAVMLFDTWGGVLTGQQYEDFSLQYMHRIIDSLHKNYEEKRVPNIVFTKGGGQWLEKIANTGCDALGIDWSTSLGDARQRVGGQVALQGNLDPMALFAKPEALVNAVKKTLADFGEGPGHVFNLGHGIVPQVLPERVKLLVDTVHGQSG